MLNWKILSIFGMVVFASAAGAFHWLTAPQELPQANQHTTLRPVAPSLTVTSDDAIPAADRPATPMDEYRLLLDRAEDYLQSTEGYTATFIRQVRKDGELLDREQVAIKIRHDPFAVYMKWQDDDGQEALYADGENDGKVLARRSRGFFRNTIKLDPTSRMAMEDSRYPIYELGMLELVRNAKEALSACPDIDAIGCEAEPAQFDGQPTLRYTITFDSPELQPVYSKCVIYFTVENPMPLQITSDGWKEDGSPQELIEHYHYQNVQMNPGFAADEFKPEHEAYAFRR